MAKVLRHKELPADDESVVRVLRGILDWLIQQTDILDVSRPADGYQIRHDRLFFCTDAHWCRCDQCQRLSSRGDALPCPHVHCRGTLRPIEQRERSNFHYDDLCQKLVPLRVEEHTAQLDPAKGRDYQNKFKGGDINMLSCSTTFELGIDLGDLQAVVMNNIPPTVANYKQRAGRAGRRAGGTAFILAWASNRPHDQTYFRTPAEIIGGQVRVPFIDIQNPIVIQRHANAILLSEFLRHCAAHGEQYDKSAGAFFDAQVPGGGYYQTMPQWIVEKKGSLFLLLEQYSNAVKGTFDPAKSLELYAHQVKEKGYDHYQTIADFYKGIRNTLVQQLTTAVDSGGASGDEEEFHKWIKRYRELLDRLQSEDTINYCRMILAGRKICDSSVVSRWRFENTHLGRKSLPINGSGEAKVSTFSEKSHRCLPITSVPHAITCVWSRPRGKPLIRLISRVPCVRRHHLAESGHSITISSLTGFARPTTAGKQRVSM